MPGFNNNLSSGDTIPIKYGDSMAIDAFGNLRTSTTNRRGDIEFIYDKQPLLMKEVVGGAGTATHNATNRDVILAVNDAVDGSGLKFSQAWHNPYSPGSSQKIDVTVNLDATGIGGGTASFFIRNNGSDTEIPQVQWSDDPSLDIDWSKSHIVQFDFQSLKVGRQRYGLVRAGLPMLAHVISNDNLNVSGYWQSASLPLTWNIYNTATTTVAEVGYFDDNNGMGLRYTFPSVQATATVRAICATVKSESGGDLFNLPGFNFPADMGVTAKTVSTTLVPLISIRPTLTINSIANNSVIIPIGFGIQTSNPIRYVLLINATLNDTVWTAAATISGTQYSGVEYNTDATTVSNGIPVDSDYNATARNVPAVQGGLLGRDVLSLTPDGVQTTLTLAAIRSGGLDSSVLAGFKWKEIR